MFFFTKFTFFATFPTFWCAFFLFLALLAQIVTSEILTAPKNRHLYCLIDANNSKATKYVSNEDQLILYNFIKIPTIGTIYQQREVSKPTAIDRVGAVLYHNH